ncbi:MAG: HepT-like ribonuclease domain-containing protein [Parvibaculum sp.]|uniref:HepT-like ribonuclease domain-containing protein n=1 Tax=Parvibaculum sp. TaxID=2024848 RepID=UPI003C78D82A
MPSKTPEKRLGDILEQIARIESHIVDMNYDTFVDDQKTLDAVERCLERICEAARKVGDRYDEKYPDVQFNKLRDFGSMLRHDYDVIISDRIWEAATERLPILKAAVRAELDL